jgi:hypothetical protein
MTLFTLNTNDPTVSDVFAGVGRPAFKLHWLKNFVDSVGLNSAYKMDSRAANWMADNRPESELLRTSVSVEHGRISLNCEVIEPTSDEPIMYRVQLGKSVGLAHCD